MRALAEVRRAFLFTGAVSFIVFCSGCSDKGVEPKPQPEPKDYKVYYADILNTPSSVFAVHTISRECDSFPLWKSVSAATVSVDGRELYLVGGGDISVVGTDSMKLIRSLPYSIGNRTAVSVSPDGRFLAITGNGLIILSAIDYSIVFRNSDTTRRGSFSSDSKSFYCPTAGGNLGQVYKVNFQDSPQVELRKSIPGGAVVQVTPSLDNTKWFLYLRLYPVYTWAFAVYDVSADSIVFSEVLVPGGGGFALSPDGKHVYYTNPGVTGTDPPTWWTGFKEYDIAHNQASVVSLTLLYIC